MASKDGKRIKDKVLPLIAKVEDDDWSDEWELVSWTRLLCLFTGAVLTFAHLRAQVALIDPGSFRLIDELLQKEVKGAKKIETMSFVAGVEDDGRIE